MTRDDKITCSSIENENNGMFSRWIRNNSMSIERDSKTLSKRQRVKKAARKLFFTAALSSSMWLKGHGSPSFHPPAAHAILGMAKKEAPAESGKAGIAAKVFPIVAIAGGVVVAKRFFSDDDSPTASSSSGSIDLGDIPTNSENDQSSDEEKEALRKLMTQKKDVPVDADVQKQIREREARRDARMGEDQRRVAMENGKEEEAERIANQLKAEREASLQARKAEEEATRNAIAEQEAQAGLRAEAEAKTELEAKKRAQQEEEDRIQEEELARQAAAQKAAALKAKAEEEARRAMVSREKEEAQLTSEMEVGAKKVRDDEEQEARLVAEANAARIKAVEDKQIQAAKLKSEQEKIARDLIDPSEKYGAIDDLGERAFQILLDLDMVEQTPDPDDPSYDNSHDDKNV